MSDFSDTGGDEPEGLPGWVMTFADLMTLLMCFFVLMLSFSEMDVAKFKQLAGSMQEAFGVQAEVEVKTMPRGTSIVAQEFSPGRPERTLLNQVRQATVNSNLNSLEVGQMERARELEAQERAAEREAEQLSAALADEIEAGKLLVRSESTNVVVQILEQDSFASGSSDLDDQMLPTLERVGSLLDEFGGAIAVSGHTDNVPIANGQYRSNWDLSAARAATVAHELLEAGLDPARLMISGHADTQPRAANDTPENRALNRRIDITLFTNRDRHETWTSDDAEAVL
ncbi:MAG: MotB family protein [Gammaproteobacteria bacterium]|jgi:chemotaxis protein MotB